MKYEDYKKEKDQKDAYKLAGEIQENFAFIGSSQVKSFENRPYEGHLAAIDVLNKIDSMVRMFECTVKDNPSDKSAQKIVDVISPLYDLAQAKLVEAKKQCVSYMKKASGVVPVKSKSPEVSKDIDTSYSPPYQEDGEDVQNKDNPALDTEE